MKETQHSLFLFPLGLSTPSSFEIILGRCANRAHHEVEVIEEEEEEDEEEKEEEDQAARITHRLRSESEEEARFGDPYRLYLDTSSTTYDGGRSSLSPFSASRGSEVERCSIDSCHGAAFTPLSRR